MSELLAFPTCNAKLRPRFLRVRNRTGQAASREGHGQALCVWRRLRVWGASVGIGGGGLAGSGGFTGGDAGYGSDARSGRDGADQRNKLTRNGRAERGVLARPTSMPGRG